MSEFLGALKDAFPQVGGYLRHFAEAPSSDIHPELLDKQPSRFAIATESPHAVAVKGIKETAANQAATKQAIEKGTPGAVALTEPEINGLREAALKAETDLHGLLQEHATIGREAEKVYVEKMRAIKGTSPEAIAQRTQLQEEFRTFKDVHAERAAVIAAERQAVADAAGTKMIGGSATAVHEVEGAASAIVSGASAAGKIIVGTKEAEKLGVIGEAAYAEKGFVGKLMAGAKAKLNVASIENGAVTESKLLGKSMKAGGAALGVVIGGYGLKDLGQVVGVVGPDVDEQGKEVPADSGKLFKALAELGAGAGAVYISLVKGGKGLATGMVK